MKEQTNKNEIKTFAKICDEIKKTRATITDEEKTAADVARRFFRDNYASATEEEHAKDRAAYNAAVKAANEEHERNTDAQILIAILKDNARRAWMAENLPKICEIWNRYEGKPHGEKTAAKIREELRAAVGVWVYIGNEYDDAKITAIFDRGAPFGRLEMHARPAPGENLPALRSNKVQKLAPELFRVWGCGEYVENPREHLAKLKEARARAAELEKELKAACHAFNALTRDTMRHASARDGVSVWWF